MKKVLILAYDFPPYVSAGGFRPYSWYKYLHEFGIEPVVVTRQWNNKYGNSMDYIAPSDSSKTIIEKSEQGTIIRTPYFPNLSNRLLLNYGELKFKLLRKFITAYYEFAQFLFLFGPKSQLYFAANDYLSTNKADVIIATGDPFILFRYASILSKKYNIPWIADYRDPWSDDVSIRNRYLLKIIYSFLEKNLIQNAFIITTTINFFILIKHQISPKVRNEDIFIVPNGYEKEAFENIKEIKQKNDVLNIALTGTIEKWHPVKSFIKVISKFISDNKEAKLKINFYGINTPSLLNKMLTSEFPDIRQNISISPKIPHSLLLKELAKNNLMLLFNSYSHMGTKIYDYIGINRTILFCYADDEEAKKLKEKYYLVEETGGISAHLQQDLINETNSGYVVKDANHLYDLLGNLYDEFQKNGYIKCNTKNTEKYSRKHQTKILADIIKNKFA